MKTVLIYKKYFYLSNIIALCNLLGFRRDWSGVCYAAGLEVVHQRMSLLRGVAPKCSDLRDNHRGLLGQACQVDRSGSSKGSHHRKESLTCFVHIKDIRHESFVQPEITINRTALGIKRLVSKQRLVSRSLKPVNKCMNVLLRTTSYFISLCIDTISSKKI